MKSVTKFADTLVSLDWHQCQEELEKNVLVYKVQGDSYYLKSGDDEEHTQWHNMMEDIIEKMVKTLLHMQKLLS